MVLGLDCDRTVVCDAGSCHPHWQSARMPVDWRGTWFTCGHGHIFWVQSRKKIALVLKLGPSRGLRTNVNNLSCAEIRSGWNSGQAKIESIAVVGALVAIVG
jgi:hypothetical protein